MRPHELPGGGQVLRYAGEVAVEVHAEQVEGVAARVGDVVEELAGSAAFLAAEHVVAAAAEHHGRGRIGLLDRAVHGGQLLDVFGRGPRPEQVRVARLVVALPVPHPPGAMADQLADEFEVRALVAGRRRRQEVGRLPGTPRRARAQGDPDLLVAAQLPEQGVHRLPLPTQPGPDWRADLEGLATHTRQMTGRHPWYPALFHTRPPAGPHMMERLEFMLGVLTAQGATPAAAMTYAALIDRYILGSGLQEAEEARMSRAHGLDDDAGLESALAAIHDLAAATGRYPRLTSWLAHPCGPPVEEQFRLGLGFLLDGIARSLKDGENPGRSAEK